MVFHLVKSRPQMKPDDALAGTFTDDPRSLGSAPDASIYLPKFLKR